MSGLRYSGGRHAFPHCAPKSQEDVVRATKLFQQVLARKHKIRRAEKSMIEILFPRRSLRETMDALGVREMKGVLGSG